MEVSEIGFGAWAIGSNWGTQRDDDSREALAAAVDAGVNFVDTAFLYGQGKSERIVAGFMKERSERIYVTTKTPPTDGPWPPSPYCQANQRFPETYLRERVEQHRKDLDTDRLDVLLLHTWTRAWNKDPVPLATLRKLQEEGKIAAVGVSTPEHDQNAVIELMQKGLVDVVEVVFNIFEQEPASQLLPVAAECDVGIIIRVAFDEGSLTGKFTKETTFEEGDFRNAFFAGDRLARTVERVEAIEQDIADTGLTPAQAALRFALDQEGVSTVIPGIRNKWQAEANTGVSDLPPLSGDVMERLRHHRWNRAFWYSGK
jgi:aryl-alcohol dehydrogenase-like predicted oxidoreductase